MMPSFRNVENRNSNSVFDRCFRVEIGEVVTEVIVEVVVEAAVALAVEPPTHVPQHTADLVAKHQKRKK